MRGCLSSRSNLRRLKGPNMKKLLKKLSLVDYIIIIAVICAVIFAFIHITTDDSANIEKTAFDASTISKMSDTYFPNYQDGKIIKATVDGINATNGEPVSINGTVVWFEDTGGANVRLLIESENGTYLVGLYKTVPEADIYINTISLETDGSKYEHLVEFHINPENVTSLNDLVDGIPENTDYEISTRISTDSVESTKMQQASNYMDSQDKKSPIKAMTNNLGTQIVITKAKENNIKDFNSVLGNVSGITEEITIRVYNCSDSQMNAIKNNYDVLSIRNF